MLEVGTGDWGDINIKTLRFSKLLAMEGPVHWSAVPQCSTTMVVSIIRRSITVGPSSNVVVRQPKCNEKITNNKILKQLRTVFLTKSSRQWQWLWW